MSPIALLHYIEYTFYIFSLTCGDSRKKKWMQKMGIIKPGFPSEYVLPGFMPSALNYYSSALSKCQVFF